MLNRFEIDRQGFVQKGVAFQKEGILKFLKSRAEEGEVG